MIETGQIVENFQGRFAKVVKVTENGMVLLTAWHHKRNYAEDDTVAVTRLNEFGLSQVLKGGENTPKQDKQPKAGVQKKDGTTGTAGTQDKQPKAVTDMNHAELKAYAKELGLSQGGKQADLVARITEHLAKQIEDEMIDHVVTEEDLEANPELAEEGVKVGDTIKVPKAE